MILPRPRAIFAVAFLFALALPLRAQTYQWVAPVNTGGPSLLWSDSINWINGLVPPAAGSAGTTLIFGTPFGTSYTATDNLGGAFSLNQLILQNNGPGALTVRNGTGSGLTFTGANASINVTGAGPHTLSDQSGALGVALNSNLAINMGVGSLNISSVISGAGGITVNGAETNFFVGALTLSGNNTFSGGVTLQTGNLILNGGTVTAAPLGTGTLTINGGFLSSASSLTRVNGPIALNSDLRFANGTITLNGAINVANATIGLQDFGGSINLNTALNIQGATVLGGGSTYFPTAAPATLTLAGNGTGGVTTGTLLQTSSISLLAGATLAIDNSTSTSGNLADRVNDAAPVTMHSGTVSFRSATAGSSETLGAVNFNGYSTLEARPGTGASGALTLASLTRADRGTLLVRGQNLGDASAANHGTILATGGGPALGGGGGAAGSTTISIVPWAVGGYSTSSSTVTANSFATYDPVNGFRPLNTATEFATTLGLNPFDNVRLSATTNNDAPVTVNSLVIAAGNITGSGTISVNSGALLYSGGSAVTASNSFAFGASEAVVTTGAALTISGNLTGTAGLTKGGQNSLILTGNNSGLTGPLTINGDSSGNGSRVDITSAASLPGTGPITIHSTNGSVAGIGINGNIEVTRDIVTADGLAGLTTLNASSLGTFSGNISGSGGVSINSSTSFGLIELTGNNTYTGVTRVGNGTLRIHSDANMGDGGALILSTATNSQGLELLGDWTTSRTLSIPSTSGLFTNTNNAVLNGSLVGGGGLTKFGSGTLTLNGNGSYTGPITVTEGNLFVNATLPANVAFNSGGVLGGTGHVGNVNFAGGTLAPGAIPGLGGTFRANSFTLPGGSQIVFDLGMGGDLIAIDSALTRANAGVPVNFTFNSLAAQAGSSYDLITFGQTTFAATDFTYSGPNGLTGTFELTSNSLRFNVATVPEPATTGLLGMGLLVCAQQFRRRRTAVGRK